MTNKERIQIRIAHDKYRKAQKRAKRNSENDNFHSVITQQHYIEALNKCQKGVGWKGSVQNYSQNAIVEIFDTITSIENGKLPRLSNTNKIELYERGKRRVIIPITIKDRMTQRVLCDHALVPVFKHTLIYDNGASLEGKGVEFTRDRLDVHLNKAIREYGTEFYALSFDFKGFFDNISHRTCLNVLSQNFHDKYIIGIVMAIIKSYQSPHLELIPNKTERDFQLQQLKDNKLKGICLGSQISQIMALVVPNKLDHFVKDKMMVKHYIRYMDDGIILHNDKKYLKELYESMKKVCDELGLTFNEKKTKIVKISRGFVFLKVRYRVTNDGYILKTLTKPGIVRMRRKLKKFRKLVDKGEMNLDDVFNSVQSWLAHSKVAKSYRTRRNMLKLYNDLFDGYRITKKYHHTEGGKHALLQTDKWNEFRWDWHIA